MHSTQTQHCNTSKLTTQVEGVALRDGYSWSASEDKTEAGDWRVCSFIFFADIKISKLKATAFPLFLIILACQWQKHCCIVDYCCRLLNEKLHLVSCCGILSVSQCSSFLLFSVSSVRTKTVFKNKCSDGCSLLHNGCDWPLRCRHGNKKTANGWKGSASDRYHIVYWRWFV